jgi:hypothetical protein
MINLTELMGNLNTSVAHHSKGDMWANKITLVNTIFVTSKLFSVSDIFFYTEFKYVLSFSISRKVFKGHTVII